MKDQTKNEKQQHTNQWQIPFFSPTETSFAASLSEHFGLYSRLTGCSDKAGLMTTLRFNHKSKDRGMFWHSHAGKTLPWQKGGQAAHDHGGGTDKIHALGKSVEWRMKNAGKTWVVWGEGVCWVIYLQQYNEEEKKGIQSKRNEPHD